MKLAVTYELKSETIGQHFGRTEAFKFYNIEDGKVVDSEIVRPDGAGHGTLPPFLKNNGVEVVICGCLGGPMVSAIENFGIELIAGVSGKADGVVESYLKGELKSDMNAVHAGCSGHHHEHGCSGHDNGHSCSDHDDGHSCNGHGSGEHNCQCHGSEQIGNNGKTCRVHYVGTFNDGEKFDSSYDRGEPLEFICGIGMMIKGFDLAVRDMKVGETKEIHLMPEEAYGMPDENAIIRAKISELPGSEGLTVGQQVYLSNQYGQPVPVKVIEKDEENIVLDANHEMAGKELNFKIELVEVR